MKRVTFFLYSMDGGGAERVALQLMNTFVQRGLRVDLFLVERQGPLLTQLAPAVRVQHMWPLCARRGFAWKLLGTAMGLLRLRPQCLFTIGEWPNLLGPLLRGWLPGLRRVVLRECNTKTMIDEPELYHVGQRERRWSRRAYGRADAWVSISQAVASHLRRELSHGRPHVVIPNPVDLQQYNPHHSMLPVPHPWCGEGSDEDHIPILLAVGRLHPQKDYPTLLRAVAAARRQRPVRLWILGDGPQRAALEELAEELGIAAEVDFLGYRADPRPYYQHARMLVHAATFEGFGMIYVEAMAQGLPVVSTSCMPREIIPPGDQVLLSPVGDAQVLGEQIVRMLERPRRPQQLRDFVQRFDLPLIARRYYQELAAQPRDCDVTVPVAKAPLRRCCILLYSLEGGGAERVALQLAEEFVHQGIRVDLVVFERRGMLLEHLPAGIRMHVLPKRFARRHSVLGKGLACWWGLVRLQPSHVLSVGEWPNVIGPLVMPWLPRRPHLLLQECNTATIIDAPCFYDVGYNEQRWAWRAYGKAAHWVAVSDETKDHLHRMFRRPRLTTVIPNPLDLQRIDDLRRAPVDHPWLASSAIPVAVAVGRLHRQKDYPTMLRALATLPRDSLRLLILGEGPERAALEALIQRLGIGDRVAFLGFQSNPYPFFARARMLVHAARFEGFGIIFAEAMACGIPVVTTDCIPRLLRPPAGGVRVVPVGDHRALGQAMLAELAKPGDGAALRGFVECLDVSQIADRYRLLLEQAPSRSPSGRRL